MRLACTLLALAAVATPALAQRPVLKQNVLQYTTADSGTVAITGVTVIDGRGGAAKKGFVDLMVPLALVCWSRKVFVRREK